MNDPARTARLQAALATLEEATADPMMLAMLSPEELARLRRAAGEIFSPDVDLRRRISRARARGQKVAQIEREQAKLDQTEMTGAAGGGMVEVTLTGKGDMRKLKIDRSLVDPNDVEVLEDLILAAFNDARRKVEDFTAGEMQKIAGGMKLPPGIKLPF